MKEILADLIQIHVLLVKKDYKSFLEKNSSLQFENYNFDDDEHNSGEDQHKNLQSLLIKRSK